MVRQSVPLEVVQQVQQAGFNPDPASHVTQAQFCAPGMGGPPNAMMPPGLGMAGGGPGLPPMGAGGNPFVPGAGPPGVVNAVGALTGGQSPYPAQRTEVRFNGPNGMRIAWFGAGGEGRAGFGQQYLEAPGRYNFLQAAIYRLKLSDIPNRPGLELYPTLEVVPANAKTAAFLAHTSVPVTFTEEDFNQVQAGNYLVKVIYLPDPQFQDLATTGVDEVISSRLEPGVDPIAEAHRRGSILLVVRLGNIDLEAPNTPAMDAPSPFGAHGAMPPAVGAPNGVLPPPNPGPQGVALAPAAGADEQAGRHGAAAGRAARRERPGQSGRARLGGRRAGRADRAAAARAGELRPADEVIPASGRHEPAGIAPRPGKCTTLCRMVAS